MTNNEPADLLPDLLELARGLMDAYRAQGERLLRLEAAVLELGGNLPALSGEPEVVAEIDSLLADLDNGSDPRP